MSRIFVAGAALDDDEAIMLLFPLFPSPAHLCAIVERSGTTQEGLEDETETVRFVRCVGRELCVYWVPDVTPDQAAAITAACEPIRHWSVGAFTAAVGRALGARVYRVQ